MAAEKPSSKRRWWAALRSPAEWIDALPSWAKVIVLVLGGAFFFYSIAHDGLGTTLLRVIFSP